MQTETKKQEIECLNRIMAVNGSLDDLMSFLIDEKLLDRVDVRSIKTSSGPAKELQRVINTLKCSEKLQLVEYEWVILPNERVKLTLISDRATKEFGFSL